MTNRFSSLRQAANLSLTEAAEFFNMSTNEIEHYEQGVEKVPMEKLLALKGLGLMSEQPVLKKQLQKKIIPPQFKSLGQDPCAYLPFDEFYCGRSEQVMKKIETEAIALSFWSPPYFVGKEYEKDATYETWQNMLNNVILEHFRVLKKGGFMIVNIADILCFSDENMPRIMATNISNRRSSVTREDVLAMKALHPNLKRQKLAELLGCSEQTVDRRLNGNNIRGGKYQNQTKVKLVGGALEKYAESAGFYLYDKRVWVKDPSWANSRWVSNTLKAVSEYEDIYIFWKPGEYVIDREKLTKKEWKDWGSRAVWYIKSVRKNDDHEAKFPHELAERVIRIFSSKGDVVLDPFMGSGTTALAAKKHDRRFIGIDKEEKYVKLSKLKMETYLKQSSFQF